MTPFLFKKSTYDPLLVRIFRTIGQSIRSDGWDPTVYDRSVMFLLQRETRRAVPKTAENEPILKRLSYLLSCSVEPEHYDIWDWEAHSYRTQDDILDALDRAAVLAETGEIFGRGRE